MKKLLVVALATMMTQQAMASNWFLFNEDGTSKDYIDLDSIQTDYLANGTPVMATWTQTEFKQAQDLDVKKNWSIKGFTYFDCRARKLNTEYIVGYDKQDRAVGSENNPSFSRYSSANWKRVVPGTTSETLLNTVCAYAN